MKRTHWETIRALAALLRVANDNGTIVMMDGYTHPHTVNAFCDAVNEMASVPEDELNED